MGTIADKLAYLADTKTDIASAIAEKGGSVAQSDTFRSYGDKIRDLPTGGSTSEGWQPPSDWWDIESILANDVQEGYTPRYIFLLADTIDTINFPGTGTAIVGGTAWKTSDGQFYTAATTHTWDRSKDKPYSEGYKTRYVIVYSATPDIAINHRNIPSLFVCFGDCNITSMVFGNISSPSNRTIKTFRMSEVTTVTPNVMPANCFRSCAGLQSIVIPFGSESINSGQFATCSTLASITIPASVASIDPSAFDFCYTLTAVNLPDSFNISVNFSASNSYTGLSVSSMLDIFSKLKDNTGETAKTLTLGANNLAKLTAEEKAIATNKNWTLA